MSFRGKYPSRFRRSGNHEKSFRGRTGGFRDYNHRRDFEQNHEHLERRGRGRRYDKHPTRSNLRSPRSRYMRGRYQQRGRSMGFQRHFEQRESRKFSPRSLRSPIDFLEEESTHMRNYNQSFGERPGSPFERFDDSEDEHLEDFTMLSDRRSLSPLIIHRNFEREDFQNTRDRSLDRRERSPFRARPTSCERDRFHNRQEQCFERTSRSSSTSFKNLERSKFHNQFERPRSQLSIYSARSQGCQNIHNRSLERHGSNTSIYSGKYRRDGSHYSYEFDRRPSSRFSNCSRGFRERNCSNSPNRFLNRRSESNFSLRSRSFDRNSKFEYEEHFERGLNSCISVRSGSFERCNKKESHYESFFRSRSPFSSHSKGFDRESLRCNSRESHEKLGYSNQGRSLRRGGFRAKKSPPKCFSPVGKQTSLDKKHDNRKSSPNSKKEREKSFERNSGSLEEQYQSHLLEHQKRCHEKRSESSIERFLNDCKKSVEKRQSKSTTSKNSLKDYSNQSEISSSSNTLHKELKGLDPVVNERVESFDRPMSPDKILTSSDHFLDNQLSMKKESNTCQSLEPNLSIHKDSKGSENNLLPLISSGFTERENSVPNVEEHLNLSPISKSSLDKVEHLGKKLKENAVTCKENFNDKMSLLSKCSKRTKVQLPKRTKSDKVTTMSEISGEQTIEDDFNLSPISNSSIFERMEIAERKDFESRLSPISSQSGSIGKKETASNRFLTQDISNLSPISKSSYQMDLSPISQTECINDDKNNDRLPKKKRKRSNSSESMREFLAELERDEIYDERFGPNSQQMQFSDPFKVVPEKVQEDWKPEFNSEGEKEQIKLMEQHFNKEKNCNLFGRAFFQLSNNDNIKELCNTNTYDTRRDLRRSKESFKSHNEQFNSKEQIGRITNRQQQHLFLEEQYKSQNMSVTYPGLHPPLLQTSHMQALDPNPSMPRPCSSLDQSSMQNSFGNTKLSSFSHSSDQTFRNPIHNVPEKSYHRDSFQHFGNVHNPHKTIEKGGVDYNERNSQYVSCHNVSESIFKYKDNESVPQAALHKHENLKFHEPSTMSSLPPPPSLTYNFPYPGASNSFFESNENKSTLNQEMDKFTQHFEMPRQNYQFQSEISNLEVPLWQRNTVPNPLQGNPAQQYCSNYIVINPEGKKQNESYFAGIPEQQIELNSLNSNQMIPNRPNLKMVFDFAENKTKPNMLSNKCETTLQGLPFHNVPNQSLSYNVMPLQQPNEIKTQKDGQWNFTLSAQKTVENLQPLKITPTCVEIQKYLSFIFGFRYLSAILPHNKEVIVIEDEDNETEPKNVEKTSERIVPDPIFVEKHKDSPPSPEELKQMFKTFVIYFGVRNNSQLEKDPFVVIQESFSRSQRFGQLLVEETEEFHNFLPVPKQVCALRWNGVLLSKVTGYSKDEARHKASIALINTLARICYTVQAKYSYYCGGKLPKFMMKTTEQPGIYKLVDRNELTSTVVSTLKILKEKNYYTGRGVDTTDVKVVLGFLDDFFRNKNTFCELIFGNINQMDYTFRELETICYHVKQLPWMEWRKIGGYGRGSYTAVCRKKTPQELCCLLLGSDGDNVRYRLIPPQDPWIDLLMPDCQYNPNMKKFETQGARFQPPQGIKRSFPSIGGAY